MRSTYALTTSVIASAVLAIPLLYYNLSLLIAEFPAIAGLNVSNWPSLEADFRVILNVFYLAFSTLLLVPAIIYSSPVAYALSLIIHAFRGDYGVLLNAVYVLPIFLYGALNVLSEGWRAGQLYSFRLNVSSLLVLAVGYSGIMVLAVLASYYSGTLLWSYISILRGVRLGKPVLDPLVDFFTVNPVGAVLLAGFMALGLYLLSDALAEALVFYVKPSKPIAIKVLRDIDFKAPIKPPLSSLRNMIISLALSPPIYYLVLLSLSRLGLIPEDPITGVLARWALSLLVLAVVWRMLTRLLTRFDEAEPGPW
ncbi:MAG: hypothetical protein ACK4H7_02940, partial [Acidilobaceae archaeon]